MKKLFLTLLLPALLTCLAGCGGTSGKQTTAQAPGSCDINVSVGFPEYTSGVLCTVDGGNLDSLRVDGGQLHIVRTDSTSMPYVAIISLENPSVLNDRIEMPVVVESGSVQVEIGEYITTVGTPLNVSLQKFLNGLQSVTTSARQQDMTEDEVNAAFSSYYRQQILERKDNPVGGFIYSRYGSHLNEGDLQEVKAALGKQ